jgi:ectoine hydroxylase
MTATTTKPATTAAQWQNSAVTQWQGMTRDEREQFERDGFLIVRGALDPRQVRMCRDALDRARAQARQSGELGANGCMHLLSAVARVPELAFLLDHPTVFRNVWSLLGWNIHVYHSHIDVHPTAAPTDKVWWPWHQDGGRQNRELETDPRPRMSVKVAYWLSDLTETGRGNFTIVPASHTTNWIDGPPRRDVPWPAPAGARQLTVRPGDAVVFDRRLWHARSDNHSDITRYGAFFGYTYRWVVGRDEVEHLPLYPEWTHFTPVQRQLLGHCGGAGEVSGDHRWGHYPDQTPLYGELAERGLLDSSIPALIP